MTASKQASGIETDNSAAIPCGLLRHLAIIVYDIFAVVALLILTTALAMLLGFREIRAFQDPLYTLILLAVWFLYLGWCWRNGGRDPSR